MPNVKDITDKVRSCDPLTTTVEEFTEIIRPLFVGLRMECPTFTAGLKLFRIRRVRERPINIKEVGFPPAHLIKRMGRLNMEGEGIGYLSTSRKTAYYETRPVTGDYVALTRWRTLSAVTVIHIGFTPQVAKILGSVRTGSEYGWAANTVRETGHGDIYNFLSEQFVETVDAGQEYKYKITNAIGRLLGLPGPIDGIMYPSIAMWANGDNIALFKRSLDKVSVYSVEFNLIKSIEEKKFDVDLVDGSANWNEDGIINWKGKRLDWKVPTLTSYRMETKDDEWICKDEHGVEVDPS